MVEKNIQEIRRNYKLKSLDIKDVSINPFVQFETWFNETLRAGLLEPTAFILATSTLQGKPSARTLLLKEFDEKGFCFYTNYNSRKGKELKENNQASMLFFWPELERQIRIEGSTVKLLPEKSFEYFDTRPFKSRIGAWASEQSSVISGRMTIIKKFFEYLIKFHGNNVPLPPFWGGYRLIPEEFEFWQGRANRLHDRIRYKIKGNSWSIERLSP
jgi:pyridoxamine 5'-phosphate oxidase